MGDRVVQAEELSLVVLDVLLFGLRERVVHNVQKEAHPEEMRHVFVLGFGEHVVGVELSLHRIEELAVLAQFLGDVGERPVVGHREEFTSVRFGEKRPHHARHFGHVVHGRVVRFDVGEAVEKFTPEGEEKGREIVKIVCVKIHAGLSLGALFVIDTEV